MPRHGAVLLRGGDVRSPGAFAAVFNSLNCEAYDCTGKQVFFIQSSRLSLTETVFATGVTRRWSSVMGRPWMV